MSVYDWFRLAHDTPFIVASPVATLLAYGVRKRSIQHSGVSIQPLTQTRRFRALFGNPFCVAPAGALFCFISTRHLPFGSLTLASDRGRAIIGRACSALDCAGGRTIRGFRLHSREAQKSNHLPQRTQRPQRKKSDFAECSLSRNELQRDSGRARVETP